MKRVWEPRTGSIRADLLAYSESVTEDAPFVAHDLAGSVAHVAGLHRAGLLDGEAANALIKGLQGLWQSHEAGGFVLDAALEDVHMNIEARLTADLGDVGRRLHTGRSRNDQVATCITLYARQHLAHLAQACLGLAEALAQQARTHAATPWTARTHGQPAQPATVGFLLAAHALRMHAAAAHALTAFEAVGESPLGSGAVAGSTLPLDPAFTARLMGLRPPRNALLATGSRDTVLAATEASARAGLAAASLAQDLLDLFAAKAMRVDSGYTTGSSLMPQKRNPDALELARANGKRLQGVHAEAVATVAGLGLGYHRDFQATKPLLTGALATACGTLELLAPLVASATFDAKVLAAGWSDPGLVATDVAEALVACGLPFRTAYTHVAHAAALAEAGTPMPVALEREGLSPVQLEAALGALQPDPAKRRTAGGTAPERVAYCLDEAAHEARTLAPRIASAQATALRPFRLLGQDPQTILENEA